jgi:hypothetical protein
MKDIECKTQAELDAATQNGDRAVVGSGYFAAYGSAQVRAYGSAQVTAYDSAQVKAYDSAQVRAYGSAQVRAYGSAQVKAYGSAQVRAYDSAQVKAYDSAQVTAHDSAQVKAYDSAQVRAYGSAQVRAYGSAQVTAYDSAQVRAGEWVAVTIRGSSVVAKGGTQIQVPAIASVGDWVEFYGVEQRGKIIVVYKGVDGTWKSPRGAAYVPGTATVANDWDGGHAECGGGLHFSPRPEMTVEFFNGAARFVECEIAIADIAVPKADATYPQKIKARACRNIREVTIDGEEVAP